MGLVRQSVTTLASRLLITIVNIPISILVARTLGVEGQGIYAAAATFPNLWAAVWLMSVDAAHTWSIAGGRTSLGRALGNTILWTLLLSTIAVPTYLWAVRFLDPEKVRALLPILGITAAAIPLLIARALVLSSFLGMGQVDRYNFLNVLSQVVLLVLLVGVLLIGRGGAREAVWAYVASLALLVLVASIWIGRKKDKGDRLRVDPALAKGSLSYGLRGYGATIFGQLNYRFDQVLVTQFAGIAAQGYYSIAVLLAEKLAHISNSIQLVLFPKVSASTPEEANRITATACRHGLFWVAAAGGAMAILGQLLIRILYGSEFLPALSALLYLIPGIFLLTFWKVLAVDLSGRNRRFPTTVASGVAFAANTLLNLWWIPKHGILGAAWSSTISYALQSLVVVILFVRVTGVPFRNLVVPRREDLEIYRRLARRVARGDAA